ncbi:tetratricopeptide repeat-containing sensor histidine kinase [Sediminibacterium sp.]|uniref:tetratricopeptide repeat-containing sensor histidine kinase n=1 Tax=Sediminibacterium sp. TaxID=1917865 RepID=UPI0027369665|nr:tetratricopeptide repeat-containing sensor histidine kinase [Sediminibacterium sp.]MDP3392397.1 tetratricopeptide repeat-containing sensor histidine kinase [Sediminibacterium sp.]MDP3566184.1 tetratricopeptide repeat-containing sensor histidine kinase [Sediminibacterium sp.]
MTIISVKCILPILLLSLLFTGCTNTIDKAKADIEKEILAGEVYIRPVKELFTKGELNQVSTCFSQISKNPALTPVMKLMGYSYVYYTFERMDRFDSAIMYQDSCITVIEKLGLEKIMPSQYAGYLLAKSASLFKLHQPEEANDLFYKAKLFNEKYNNQSNQFVIVDKLAYVAYRQHNFKESLQNFQQLLIFQNQIESNNFYRKAEIISNIGLCFYNMKLYDSAIAEYVKALHLLDNNAYKITHYIKDSAESYKAYKTSKGVVLGNMAKVYTEIGKLDSAIILSKQSILLNNTKHGEQRDAQMVAVRLIDVYIKKKNWQAAKELLNQVQHTLESLPDENARMNWYRQNAAVLEADGKLENAYYHFKEYNRISDSIKNYQIKDAENNIIKDLRIKNQEADLSLLKKGNQLNKLYLLVTIGIITMAVIIIALVFINYKKSKAINSVLSKLNAAINQQKTALEKANADKDRVMNVVAHDLRNPIGAIANFLDIVQVKYEHSADETKILNNSQQAAVRSLHLINDLLEVNQMQSGDLELYSSPIDAVQLVQQAIGEVQYKTVAKNQTIVFETAIPQVIINIDGEKIKRVLVNLLDNAIKFSYLNTKIEVNLYKYDSHILILIKDNGMGIPANIMEHLFDNAIAIKRKGTNNEPSNGFGLSICKQIVEIHKGILKVESDEGKGTLFTIELSLT